MSLTNALIACVFFLLATSTRAQPIDSQAQWEQDPATDHVVLGGPVHTTASFSSDKPILIDQTLMLETQTNTVLHLGGTIGNVAGMSKGIHKTGAGTLVLAGTNDYDNVTSLRAGTLWLQSDLALGTIGSFLEVFSGTTLIYQPGVVIPNNIVLHDYVYDTSLPPASPNPHSVQWQVNGGVATQRGYMVLGPTWVLKQGDGVLRLAGNAFDSDGRIAIQQGGLAVDGEFMGTVHAENGAWLQGQGMLGSARIRPGGRLLSVAGAMGLRISRDLVFEPGAIFVVDAKAAGANHPVQVQGLAILSGGVSVHTADMLADLWPVNWEYPILQADAGFAGTTFDTVDSNIPFLTAGLRYDHHKVYLRLSPNAQAASVWPFSGNWEASVLSTTTEDSHFIRLAALRHVTQPRQGAFLWADVYFSDAERARYDGIPGDQRDLSGVVLGAQHSLGTDWQIAGFVGIQHASLNSRNAVFGPGHSALWQASATARINSSFMGLSAAWQGRGLALAVGAAHSWHRLSSQRHVAAGGLSDNPRARYQGYTSQLFGEFSVNAVSTPASRFTPFVQMAWVQTRMRAYDEQGGLAALHVAAARQDVLYSTLGVKGEHTVITSLGKATLYGTMAWRHAAGSITPRSRYAYVTAPAMGGFTTFGQAVSKNTVLMQAGVSAQWGQGLELSLGYTGQHGRRYHDHGLSLNVQLTF